MKFKVTYYDIETDKSITKDCVEMDYNNRDDENTFSFMPVDNPPKIYKSIVIDHPKISIHQHDGDIRILITGYQYMKSGGYNKTSTTIENVKNT